MSVVPGTRKIGGPGLGAPKPARALYEFAVDGGAVGDIALRGDKIPAGAIVVDALIHVDAVPTSGGAATIAIKVEGAADINAADAISGAPWSTTGAKRSDFGATSAPIKTTAERSVVATIATAALTAGKFTVVVWYVELA